MQKHKRQRYGISAAPDNAYPSPIWEQPSPDVLVYAAQPHVVERYLSVRRDVRWLMWVFLLFCPAAALVLAHHIMPLLQDWPAGIQAACHVLLWTLPFGLGIVLHRHDLLPDRVDSPDAVWIVLRLEADRRRQQLRCQIRRGLRHVWVSYDWRMLRPFEVLARDTPDMGTVYMLVARFQHSQRNGMLVLGVVESARTSADLHASMQRLNHWMAQR